MAPKVKITQKEFDDIYVIDKEITGETKADDTGNSAPDEMPQDTTPFLTEEEEEHDKLFHEGYNVEEEVLES